MQLVKRGAEAVLYKADYLDEAALLKERVPKQYRNPVLDERIRKQRTKQEASLLHRAKEAVVRRPALLKIDRAKNRIWMEWIEGKQLKEELNTTEKKGAWKGKWLEKAGKMVAQLHAAGIIHGDLTTSNFLVGKKELVLIDFGLGFFSEKNEDRAVDLLNFKKTFLATHASFPKGLEPFLHAYSGNNPFALPVLRQMEKVENRIRYA